MFATPLFGVAGAMLVAFAGMLAINEAPRQAGLVLFAGVPALAVAAMWMLTKGVAVFPVLRTQGVNLEAVRGDETPRIWLAAHIDTKSQPVPTLIRAVGLVFESAGILMALVLAIASQGRNSVHEVFWAIAALMTLGGAVPVVMSMVGSRSNGALDNASGVATVVAAARLVPKGIGVLITDAEELGLAGARLWKAPNANVTVLNCDGVDDAGDIAVMRAGRVAAPLGEALRKASPGGSVSVGPHFPGVLTDAMAFAGNGIASVTVSRGTPSSLLRVHSRRDSIDNLRGDGIAPTARFIADVASALLEKH